MVVAVISFYVIILKVIPPPAIVYVRNKKFTCT